MPAAIKAAHTPETLRTLARSGKDAARNARLPLAASVPEGVGRAEAGRTGGTDRQAVLDRRRCYNAEGPEGGIVRAGGRRVFPTMRNGRLCGVG